MQNDNTVDIPPTPDKFTGSGRRFHWRQYGNYGRQAYEVYSVGLEVWAGDCPTPSHAEAIANALEEYYKSKEQQ